MPRGDRTGPAGMGPMTGRAAGYCAGYPAPGFMNPYGGRFAAGLPFGYAPPPATGSYPVAPYGWGGYPAYGPLRSRGRGFSFGSGFGRGRGRGRGWW
jgi:hypothetical protein